MKVIESCLCHKMDANAFRTARDAGADSVKACFQYFNCLPKCGKCIPLVRKILIETATFLK